MLKATLGGAIVVLVSLLGLDAATTPEHMGQAHSRYVQWCGAQITDIMLCDVWASQVGIAVLGGADPDCAEDVMHEAVDSGGGERLTFDRCL